jgi:hypothetical protein
LCRKSCSAAEGCRSPSRLRSRLSRPSLPAMAAS